MNNHLRTGIRAFAGVALIVAGSVLWMSRNDFVSKSQVDEAFAQQSVPLAKGKDTDLSAACSAVNSTDGWVVFVFELELIADRTPRKYFETSPEPFGLYLEYDPGEFGLLRLGLGVGPEQWNTQLPIRYVRRDSKETVVVGIRREETRVLASVVDNNINWPGAFATDWKCDSVSVGTQNEPNDQGTRCPKCEVSAWYLKGGGTESFVVGMDALSNVREHNARRILGTTASLAGFVLIFSTISVFRRRSVGRPVKAASKTRSGEG